MEDWFGDVGRNHWFQLVAAVFIGSAIGIWLVHRGASVYYSILYRMRYEIILYAHVFLADYVGLLDPFVFPDAMLAFRQRAQRIAPEQLRHFGSFRIV